jgi:hypothetical protein
MPATRTDRHNTTLDLSDPRNHLGHHQDVGFVSQMSDDDDALTDSSDVAVRLTRAFQRMQPPGSGRDSERMSGMMPGDDGFGETRGWDRASIAFKSRGPYRPEINQEDLLLPNEAGALKTLGICLVSAFAMTILYVSIPLFMLGIFVPLGAWFGVVLLVSFPALTAILFVFSTYETRQLRRLAQQL